MESRDSYLCSPYGDELLESVEFGGITDYYVVDLANRNGNDAVSQSLEAMRYGTEVIPQPALKNGPWFGRLEVLRRVPT